MIGFEEHNGILHVDDIPLPAIAERFGTPCYVYSARHIRMQYQTLADALARAFKRAAPPMLCYACKANSNGAVLRVLKNLGGGIEVVSEGELRRALAAGFEPGKIVSTGVGKTESEIALGLKAGILQFNVESLPELDMIQRVAARMGKTAPVAFRLNPDVSGGGHDKISTGRRHDKFGLLKPELLTGFSMAASMSHVRARGLSLHIGSQVFTVERFRDAFEKMPALVGELRALGHTVESLDIGGGFPIRYNEERLLDLEAYAKWVADIILPLNVEIILEPGRYLVGNAGVLLTKVVFLKQSQGAQFIILDSAMNDLMRPALYDAWHGIEPVQNRAAPAEKYDIVGPVCETGDTFARDRSVPKVSQGDLMVIRTTGAYGASMASNYNSRPLLAEILVDGTQAGLIRSAQTYEDIFAREQIPPWLDNAG